MPRDDETERGNITGELDPSVAREATPFSMRDEDLRSREGVEAWERSQELTNLDVFDANGERLGRINKCFMKDGRLVGCEVHLDHAMQRVLSLQTHLVRIDPADITEVKAAGVRIAKAAAQVVPDARTGSPEAPGHEAGSSTFPRKVR